ncbi:MAG: NAD(P)-binding domain-containing protein, partial [Propionibacteriaceae bacterium]|nr:NAD(P)-binding domain-containing protein [Propionibacteriaceae bacterium]
MSANEKRIAFIGGGVMGETVLSALVKGGFPAEQLIVSDPSEPKLALLAERYGVETTSDNTVAVAGADVVIVVTKPYQVVGVLREIETQLRPDTLLVSLAAGLTTKTLEAAVPDGTAVVRVMPNTPARVGAG